MPSGFWRGIGVRVERARVAFGESPGIRRGTGVEGMRIDGPIFFGLLKRRKRVSGGSIRIQEPRTSPARQPSATSVSTRLLKKALSGGEVLSAAVDVGAVGAIDVVGAFGAIGALGAVAPAGAIGELATPGAGVDTAGVGASRSGAASAAEGAPESA